MSLTLSLTLGLTSPLTGGGAPPVDEGSFSTAFSDAYSKP